MQHAIIGPCLARVMQTLDAETERNLKVFFGLHVVDTFELASADADRQSGVESVDLYCFV